MFYFCHMWSVFIITCFSGRSAYDRILSYIEKAKAAGGEILIGGSGKSVHAHLEG